MDLINITRQVKSDVYLLQKHDAEKQKLQSKCWDSIRDIVDDCGNKLDGVACCSICGAKLL